MDQSHYCAPETDIYIVSAARCTQNILQDLPEQHGVHTQDIVTEFSASTLKKNIVWVATTMPSLWPSTL